MIHRLAPVLIGPCCIVAIFATALLGTDRLAFRDVSYFYTPLYDYVADRCERQPWGALGDAIWNPLDLTGMPLAGETTTAVFYPLRMLIYAPRWSAETSIVAYVVVHLLLSSVAAYWLARAYRMRRWSAAIAGITYPLSGSILFLSTNPPFLVSAAWLPFLLGGLLVRRGLSRRSSKGPWTGVGLSSTAMAMMILGGDPPTALHAAMVILATSLLRWMMGDLVQWIRKRAIQWDWRSSLVLRLFVTCAIAVILSAPQIMSSLDWSRQSDRVGNHDQVDDPISTNVDRSVAFAFSFPHWRFAEFFAPDFYGSPWPVNSRWDRVAFDDGRMRPQTALWTPTVYSGVLIWFLFPLGLLGIRTGVMRQPALRDWFVIGALGLIAAMGVYAPLYGWLLNWMPGYDSFRYPSKWLPFVALALSLGLAGGSAFLVNPRHWNTLSKGRYSMRPSLIVASVSSLGLGLLFLGLAAVFLRRLGTEPRPTDRYWGPFQKAVAVSEFDAAIIHNLVFIAGVVTLCWVIAHGRSAQFRRWLPVLAVWAALDLCVAHNDLVPMVNRSEESSLIQRHALSDTPLRWMNTLPHGGETLRWSSESSERRMVEVEARLRSAGFGRWHLERRQAKFNSFVSIRPHEMTKFWKTTKESTAQTTPEQSQQLWKQWNRDLAIKGSIARDEDRIKWSPSDSMANSGPAINDLAELGIDNEMDVSLGRSSEVRRAVYQDGNWTATATPIGKAPSASLALEVRPEQWLSQSVTVPAGDWQIEWQYSPWWHVPSILLALLSWIAMGVLTIPALIRPR